MIIKKCIIIDHWTWYNDTTKVLFFCSTATFGRGKTFAARPCCPSSLRVWVQPCLPRPQRHHPWCQPQRSSSSCLCWCHHRGRPWDHRSCHLWDPRPTCDLVEAKYFPQKISLIESSPLPKIPRVFIIIWYSPLKLGKIYNLTTIFLRWVVQPPTRWWVNDEWMMIEWGSFWFKGRHY